MHFYNLKKLTDDAEIKSVPSNVSNNVNQKDVCFSLTRTEVYKRLVEPDKAKLSSTQKKLGAFCQIWP